MAALKAALILAFSFSCCPAHASRAAELTFRGQTHRFAEINGSLVSECAAKKCQAVTALANRNSYSYPNTEGGQNPASAICWNSAHGSVVVAKDAKGNEQSVCVFADGSLTPTSELMP